MSFDMNIWYLMEVESNVQLNFMDTDIKVWFNKKRRRKRSLVARENKNVNALMRNGISG